MGMNKFFKKKRLLIKYNNMKSNDIYNIIT